MPVSAPPSLPVSPAEASFISGLPGRLLPLTTQPGTLHWCLMLLSRHRGAFAGSALGRCGLLGGTGVSNPAQKHVNKAYGDFLCQEPGAAGPSGQGPFSSRRRGQRTALLRASKGVTSDPPHDHPTSLHTELLVAPGRSVHQAAAAPGAPHVPGTALHCHVPSALRPCYAPGCRLRTEQQVFSETLKMLQVLSLSPRIPAGREGSSSGVPTARGRSSLCCVSAPACRGGLASCGHLPQVSAELAKTQVEGRVQGAQL